MPQSRERHAEYMRHWREQRGESRRGGNPSVNPVKNKSVNPKVASLVFFPPAERAALVHRASGAVAQSIREANAWWWERIAQMPIGASPCFLLPTGQVVAVESGELLGTLPKAIEPIYRQQPTTQQLYDKVVALEMAQALHQAQHEADHVLLEYGGEAQRATEQETGQGTEAFGEG